MFFVVTGKFHEKKFVRELSKCQSRSDISNLLLVRLTRG